MTALPQFLVIMILSGNTKWRSGGTDFNSVGSAGGDPTVVEFNPREISIVKAVEIEWQIND